ncbi:MAG: hypothetical protein AAF316_14145 [Cyanobacteria bacterium P01_A01_bin.80]
MIDSILEIRLQQLKDNVVRVLKLLNEYEIEIDHETDPSIKNKYRRRVEKLTEQRYSYQEELIAIKNQLNNEQAKEQVLNIESQLKQIDNKLIWLVDSQAALHQVILAHFVVEDRNLIAPIVNQLEEAQIVEVNSVLKAVESNQISEVETRILVSQMQKALTLMKEKGFMLPSGNEALDEIINYPTIDAKHALKVTVPIIPFILSYEGELGLGAGLKIKEVWNSLKNKVWNK